MKKLVWGLVIFVLLFVVLLYISVSSTNKEMGTCELVGVTDISGIDFSEHDSVRLTASNLYEGNAIKKLMQGEHYRKAWATPISVPIVFLDTLYGGMEIIKEGGGKQTHSLKLESQKGVAYSLRGIHKDPKALVPDVARILGLENIVVDGISAQHPYGALLAASLADRVGVLHTAPKVLFVPEQPFLEEHNAKFGNRLFLLEYETESKKNWTGFKNVLEIMDTKDLQQLKMKYGDQVTIDRHALVRARLFDLLIGDWDRHAKQWGWVVQKQDDNSYKAIPLPGDRDNAFFNVDGVIPSILANKKVLPELQGFDTEIGFMPGLVMPFDVYFLKMVPKELFLEEARYIQEKLSDKAIQEALEAWPKEIYKLDGPDIETKLRARRDALQFYAKEFWSALNERSLLTEPLKGSEDEKLTTGMLACFECAGSGGKLE
ncbi:MAG: hypothetical protein V7724_05380 [Sediminicola sp.]